MKKENIFYVYIHRKSNSNEIFYIGKGCKDRAHTKRGRSELWKRVVKKHGFTVEIIFLELFEWEAFQLEIFFIKEIGRKDLGEGPLINFTDGGDGSSNLSLESRKKISDANKGEKHHMFGKVTSNEVKIKISESTKGAKNHFFRKHHSEETKQKVSLANKGRPSARKGIVISEDTKRKAFENCKHRKLNYEQAEEIRNLYLTGLYTHQNLSEIFNISRSCISEIIERKTYNYAPLAIS